LCLSGGTSIFLAAINHRKGSTMGRGLLIVALFLPLAASAQVQSGWNHAPGFTVDATSVDTLQSREGGSARLVSIKETTSSGFASISMDATAFRGKLVTLSGDLQAAPVSAKGGGAICLQPRGSGGSLGFATSKSRGPVTSAEHREVMIAVPANATTLAVGVVLEGGGEMKASHLRLSVKDAPQVSASELIDAAIRIVRANALYADRVDWPTVEPRLRDAAKDLHGSVEAYPLIRDLLHSLQDNHSHFVPLSDNSDWKQHGRTQGKISVEALSDDLGYVAVPGFEGSEGIDAKAFADALSTGIARVAGSASHGWIVDLRGDTGGNMQPMLSGLAPLLGNGKLGSFKTRDGQLTPWSSGGPANKTNDAMLANATVAVLIGPHTSSSGEIVAISFEGRPNTRFFGQLSDGRTTANQSFPLPDGSEIVVASSVEQDRNGHVYAERVTPDVETAPSNNNGDTTLIAAQIWLKQQPQPR
jgi:carboxyl-terminal processing protease